jgi:hypothetical protein
MGERVRTHFVLPKETLEEFDRRVPVRKRSDTLAEVMDEWLRRERAKELIGLAGFIKDEDHPEWQSDEDVHRWVRNLRDEYPTDQGAPAP